MQGDAEEIPFMVLVPDFKKGGEAVLSIRACQAVAVSAPGNGVQTHAGSKKEAYRAPEVLNSMSVVQAPFTCSMGEEAFRAPEVLLNPQAGPSGGKGMLPLPQLVDEVVCSCPIDARRALYRNIVLCVRPPALQKLCMQLPCWCACPASCPAPEVGNMAAAPEAVHAAALLVCLPRQLSGPGGR